MADVDLIRLPGLSLNTSAPRSKELGRLTYRRSMVRKKSVDSLVWQETQNQDALYQHDRVLTLDQSEAQLELADDVKIHLYENTLVVIEPPEDNNEDGTLHLAFSRGNMRSKSDFKRLSVRTENWDIQAKKGSEISLRNDASGELEVTVESGEVGLINPENSNPIIIKKNQRARVSSEGLVEKQEIIESLVWTSPLHQRVYSFDDSAEVELKWEGPATSLEIRKPDGTTHEQAVEGQDHLQLTLQQGSYLLSLKSPQGISKTLKQDIFHAPKMTYFSPLPRDRHDPSQPLTFSWSRLLAASNYKLVFQDASGESKTFDSHDSQTELSNLSPGFYYWSVFGYDEQGFSMPPRFKYPIFLFRDLLPAPKIIEDPKPRQPANQKPQKTSLLKTIWGWVLPTAEAQTRDDDSDEVVFRWDPVNQADYYIIEISETEDFIAPVELKTTKDTEFRWSYGVLKAVYWRVSAARSDGQLGYFTEPKKVQIAKLPVEPKIEKLAPIQKLNKPQIVLQPKPKPKPKPVPKPKPQPKQVKAPAPQQSPETTTQIEPPSEIHSTPGRFSVSYAPQFIFLSDVVDEDTKVNLSDFANMGVGLYFNFWVNESWRTDIQASYVSAKLEPAIPDDLPFQDHLEFKSTSATITTRKFYWNWQLGAKYVNQTYFNRLTLETIEGTDLTLIGPHLGYVSHFGKTWVSQTGLSYLLGDESQIDLSQVFDCHWFTTDDFKAGSGLALLASYIPSGDRGGSIRAQLTFRLSFGF